jgi:L-rhamnonate dehydratase
MIITDVETHVLRQPEPVDITAADGSQETVLVRVLTDEGLVGIAEIDSMPEVVQAVIDAPRKHRVCSGLRALVVGEDPFAIRRLWNRMYQGSMFYGRRGAVMHALSGIDIALWDLVGKAVGKPVCDLLGGRKRERIKAYASVLMPETPGEVEQLVHGLRTAGFQAIKLGWGPLGKDPELDIELVKAAREVGGWDFDLMLDVGFEWSNLADPAAHARRLQEYQPYWIEEPFWPDQLASYARLADQIDAPIAAGEEDATVHDFVDLMRAGVSIVQPDVTRAGGLSEVIRIAERAQLDGRRMVPHSWGSSIIKAATLQVIGAMERAEYFEYSVPRNELSRNLASEIPVNDGYVDIPNEPGLGIELNEQAIDKYAVAS